MSDSLELKTLIHSLVNSSELLEKGRTSTSRGAFEALEDLSALFELTQHSLQEGLPVPVPVPVPVPAQTQAVAPAPTPTPAPTSAARGPAPAPIPPIVIPEKYSQSDALKDDSVLKALMEYHSLHAPSRGAKTAPRPSSEPHFRPAEIPIVENVQRKDPLRKTLRSSEPTAPVLRPRSPES